MNDTYVINEETLKQILNNMKGEYSGFIYGAQKTFENGYFFECSDSSIVSMRNKLNSYYNTLDNGYRNIIKWLEYYTNDSKNIENSLVSGRNSVTEQATAHEVNKALEHKPSFIEAATDAVDLSKGMNYSSDGIFPRTILQITHTTEAANSNLYKAYQNLLNQLYSKRGNLKIDIEKIGFQIDNLIYDNWHDATDKDFKAADNIVNELLVSPEKFTQIDLNKYNDLQKEYIMLSMLKLQKEAQLAELEMYIMNYEKQQGLVFYQYAFFDSEDYKRFVKDFDYEKEYNYYLEHANEIELKDCDKNYYEIIIAKHNYDNTHYRQNLARLEDIEVNGERVNPNSIVSYASDEQKMMYLYLLKKERNKELADKFLYLILDDINMAQGKANADFWKEQMDENYARGDISGFILSLEDAGINGLGDGFSNFLDTVENTFNEKKVISAKEYEKMYKYSYSEEYGMSTFYKFTTLLGKGIPSLVFGSLPGGQFALSVTTFYDTWNKSKRDGAESYGSFVYSVLFSTSDLLFGYVSKELSGLVDGKKGFASDILKSGMKSINKDIYISTLDTFLLGKDVDLAELSEEQFISFCYGAVSGAYGKGIEKLPTRVKCKINGVEHSFDCEGMMKYLTSKGIISIKNNSKIIGEIEDDLELNNEKYIKEIRIEDMSQVTKATLDGINRTDRVMFTIDDQRYSYDDIYNIVYNNMSDIYNTNVK